MPFNAKHSHALGVSFWGTRGSISTPGGSTEKYGGNTPCISIAYGDDRIILDAGTGIRGLGLHITSETPSASNRQQHILLSHTHWDHIQGLPFFQPAYVQDTNIVIYGSAQKECFLESILRGQMDINYFPVQMKELPANINIREFQDDHLSIGDLDIDIQEQILHPGGSVRFRIHAGGKTVVYATDVELDAAFAPETPSPKMQGIADQYRAFVKDADLLIGDGQYSQSEYADKKGWGHTSFPCLMRVAMEQGVKQVAVFHHDPGRSDTDIDRLTEKYADLAEKQGHPNLIFWSREGHTITL